MPDREKVTRGSLPHWFMPGAAHFVTYRLVDTIPIDVLRRLRAERDTKLNQRVPDGISIGEHRSREHKRFFSAYDAWLDSMKTIRWLEHPDVAQIVVDNLYHHHGSKYQLFEYTVMPNHVHVLFLPSGLGDAGSVAHESVADAASVGELFLSDEITDVQSPLSSIMHSLKSYTANEANRVLGRTGRFWQKESYDHWVRAERELSGIAEYIAQNAVTAKLAINPWDWPYCSAHDRKFPRAKALAEWW